MISLASGTTLWPNLVLILHKKIWENLFHILSFKGVTGYVRFKNSKYKEDDLTDSDAVACFKTCESFSTHMSPSLFRPPPLHLPAPQSDWNTWDDHNSVSGSNPGSFMVLMQIPSYQQTMLTSSSIMFQEFLNYHANIETYSLIFENDKTAISPPP